MKTNPTVHSSLTSTLILALLSSPPGAASEWEISGSNTARYEYYDTDGEASASPYQFDGEQYFDEFNVNISRRFSPYETLRGQVYGVMNHSDYRFGEDGFTAERVNLLYEINTDNSDRVNALPIAFRSANNSSLGINSNSLSSLSKDSKCEINLRNSTARCFASNSAKLIAWV